MKKKSMFKAVVAIAVALAFVLPGSAAFANVETIGVTSNSEDTGDMENTLDIVESIDTLDVPVHHYFYGALRIAGEPAPIGTEVQAVGNGVIPCENNPLITTEVGYYGVPDPKLDVYGMGQQLPDGTIITFYVNGETTCESYMFKRGTTTRFDLTSRENDPPYVPKDPSPVDGVTGVAVDVSLSWTGGDPNGDPVTYDVYLGDTYPPPQVVWNQSGTMYDPPGDLDEKWLYYWQIVAWDNQSASRSGPEWTFITFGPPGAIYVDDDAFPSWYDRWHVRTIQEGVNNASSGEGDTVYVLEGTYHEHVVVDKQIEMVGEHRETVIVDGDGSGKVFYVTESNINISNFTMMNGQYGISLANNLVNINIVDCNIFDHTRYGIYTYGAGYSSVVNCIIHDIVSVDTGSSAGIYAVAAEHCEIIGNEVYNNAGHSPYGYSGLGMYLVSSYYFKLRDNDFHDNQHNFGLAGNNINYYENHDIDTSNTVNGKPIHYVVGAEYEVIDGNVIDVGLVVLVRCNNMTVKNVETSNNRAGIMLSGTMESVIMDCNFSNNHFGIWLYVRSAFNQITNCNVFDNGEQGIRTQDESSWNEIVNCNIYGNVRQGYWSQGTDNNSLIGCNIYNNGLSDIGHIHRGGVRFDYKTSNNLIEDCHIYGNARGIIIYAGCNVQTIRNCELNNNILYGIILGGTASGSYDCTLENISVHDNGYGISVQSYCEGISMKNCSIDDNTYSFGLGTYSSVDVDTTNTINGKPIGLFIGGNDPVSTETSDFGWLGLISCTNVLIENMDLEGVLIVNTPAPIMNNVTVHNNIGSGILLVSSPNAEITNCITYSNSGYGMHVASSNGFNIIGCTSYGNSGDGGIYLQSSSSGNIADCVVYDSSIGISCRSLLDSTITNCDGYNNDLYGIYFLVSHHNNITDCDIYNNQKGVYLMRSSENSVMNCDIYDNEYGIHIHFDSDLNIITTCNLYNNSYGIYISIYGSYYSNNNMIYHNTVIDNDVNAYGAVRPFFEEDFESEFADCIVIDGGEDNNTWNNTNPGGRLPEGGCDGTFMIVDSDYTGPGVTMDEELISFSMDFSTVSEVILNFGQYYKHHSSSSGCVDVSNDNGSTWTNVATYTATEYGPTAIDISSIASGHSEVKVRWAYSDSGDQAYYWMVDNINILTDTNHWDDGNKGNYWDDYDGVDVDPEDGIGDTPYNITGGTNQDRYPLMVPLVDTMPPVITNVEVDPDQQMSGDPVNITCTVTDYTMVDTVIASITTPSYSTSADEFTMANIPDTDEYYCEVVYSEKGNYSYSIWANDTSGNDAVSDVYQFEITEVDLIPPVISDVALLTSDPLDTDAPHGWENFVCIVTDNIGVRDVKLNVTIDTTTVEYIMTETATDTYECNITITPHGVYTYHVWADDIGGNDATSTDEPFELPPNWDVSMNGETYIEDFVRVAGWYGVTGPNGGWIREDVSNNGEVYIEDFVLIAGHYGERWKPI